MKKWILLTVALSFLAARALVGSTEKERVGIASFYSDLLAGKLMANGKPYDPDKLTCASWDYPFRTRLLVIRGPNSVVVEVTDRGPAKRLNRLIDLSRAAFERLARPDMGLIQVRIEVVK